VQIVFPRSRAWSLRSHLETTPLVHLWVVLLFLLPHEWDWVPPDHRLSPLPLQPVTVRAFLCFQKRKIPCVQAELMLSVSMIARSRYLGKDPEGLNPWASQYLVALRTFVPFVLENLVLTY